MAEQYIELFGSCAQVHPDDLALTTRHLSIRPGAVLDVGCGPGHLTEHLCTLDVDATGIDLVPEFIDHAHTAHPVGRYAVGSMHQLPVPDSPDVGPVQPSWRSRAERTCIIPTDSDAKPPKRRLLGTRYRSTGICRRHPLATGIQQCPTGRTQSGEVERDFVGIRESTRAALRDEFAESLGDFIDTRLPSSYLDHEVVNIHVTGARDRDAVDLQKDGSREPPEPLVPVHERMIFNN